MRVSTENIIILLINRPFIEKRQLKTSGLVGILIGLLTLFILCRLSSWENPEIHFLNFGLFPMFFVVILCCTQTRTAHVTSQTNTTSCFSNVQLKQEQTQERTKPPILRTRTLELNWTLEQEQCVVRSGGGKRRHFLQNPMNGGERSGYSKSSRIRNSNPAGQWRGSVAGDRDTNRKTRNNYSTVVVRTTVLVLQKTSIDSRRTPASPNLLV